MVWIFSLKKKAILSFQNVAILAIAWLGVIYPANFSSAQVQVRHEGSPLSGFSSLDVSADGLTLYIGDAFGDAVYSMPSSGGITPVKISVDPLGSTAGLAGSPDASKVFATIALRGLGPSVVFLPSGGGTASMLAALSARPGGLAVSPNGGVLYIAGQSTHELYQMPSTGGSLANLLVGPFGGSPTDVDVSSDGNTLYFSDSGFDRVYSVSANGGTPQSISTGINFVDPVSVAVSPDGSTLFVLDSNIRIDAFGQIVTTGGLPGAIFVGPAAGGAFSLLIAGGADFGLEGKIALSPNGSTLYFGGFRRSNGAAVILSITTVPANQSPVMAANQATVVTDEGQTAYNTGTVNDPDGDAVNLSTPVGTVTDNGNGTWSWSFTTGDGPVPNQIVTITADDGNGGTAQTSFSLTINNVAPSVDAITVPIDPINISNQPVPVSATFSDPAGTYDEPYTCTIDYGDGSGLHAGTVNGMTCSGSHTYSAAGVYIVTVTVTDKDNGSGSASATNFIVIYDPSAGYVTGGGWIDSPSGAYTPDPTLAGKANFGFVSKYKKGNSIPDGNTTFHFNTANFKFKSTSYEWLVIAGPKAQYKGEGIVNNSGSYGFMLFATDGQINGGGGVDKFRIKIWDKNNGDAVVYDNQMGDPDDGEATDAIEGGSITIHYGSASKAASSEEAASAPHDFVLAQNYPNPFNPSTTFAFDLPKATNVKLTIYSITGQVVATVFSGELNAGHHTFTWEAPASIVSGVYLYKLDTAEFTSVKKMIFQK